MQRKRAPVGRALTFFEESIESTGSSEWMTTWDRVCVLKLSRLDSACGIGERDGKRIPGRRRRARVEGSTANAQRHARIRQAAARAPRVCAAVDSAAPDSVTPLSIPGPKITRAGKGTGDKVPSPAPGPFESRSLTLICLGKCSTRSEFGRGRRRNAPECPLAT